MNYPRRQQYQRLGHAIATGAGGLLAALGALLAAAQQALWIALILLLAAVSLSAYARHWSRLAARSRVGARSEEEVQRALSQLAAEGWRVRHSLPWQGRGDIDSVAIAPTGIAFAIEPKTRTYGDQHVARVREMANWLHRRRRRWSPHGALAVLCVVHARGLERFEAAVLIVSLDELVERYEPRRALKSARHSSRAGATSTDENMRERYGVAALGLAEVGARCAGAGGTGAGGSTSHVHDETREPGTGDESDRHLGRRRLPRVTRR